MEQNEKLFARYMNDPAIKQIVDTQLLNRVYSHIRDDAEGESGRTSTHSS